MSRRRLFSLCLLFALCSSCIPSLYPLYEPEDLIFKPEIVGKWQGEGNDENEYWLFTGTSEEDLVLKVKEDEGESAFDARLVSLENFDFLDIRPVPLKEDVPEFYRGHFVPTHSFYLLRVEGTSMTVAALDIDWLTTAVEHEKVRIELHELNRNLLLLTSPTDALQNLALAAARTAGFSEELRLRRIGN